MRERKGRLSFTQMPARQTAPALELVYLDFHLSGSGGGLTVEERDRYNSYLNRFPQHCAQDVNFALNVRNLQYGQRDQTYQLEMRYYNPDGNLMGTYDYGDWVFRADQQENGMIGVGGLQNSGNWRTGTYRVVIVIDGCEFAEGSFSIEEHPPLKPPPPPPPLRLESLKFYESDKDNLESEKRQYKTTFSRITTRKIHVELKVQNLLYGRSNKYYSYYMHLYHSNKKSILLHYNSLEISSETKICLLPGYFISLKEFSPDTYHVVIAIDRCEFAEGSFTIE